MQFSLDTLRSTLHNNVFGKWHKEGRIGNDGNAGNTLEDLLGIEENNLKLPDWGDIEIKTKNVTSKTYLTLLHREPLPNASIPKLLLSMGWRHANAGTSYPLDELSFRSTTQANRYSARGLTIKLTEDKILLIFDPNEIAKSSKDRTKAYSTYNDWFNDIENRNPHYSTVMPVYWNRKDLEKEIVGKLDQTLYVSYKVKEENNIKYFQYQYATLYKSFNHARMEDLFNMGSFYVDFDARTRHNHGTKFRVKVNHLDKLFDRVEIIH